MKIILNGSEREFENSLSVYEAVKSLGGGFAKNACAAIVNGKNADLRTALTDGDEVKILTFDDDYGKWTF